MPRSGGLGVIPAVRLSDHRDRRWDGRQAAGPFGLDVAYLGHVQPLPVQGESIAGEPDRLSAVLAAGLRVTNLRPLAAALERVEPVLVRLTRVLACLHQRDRGCLRKPFPFRGELGPGDDPALHLGVADLLRGRVTALPQPQGVVVHHPRAAEHASQGLLLPQRRVATIPVPDLHNTTACHGPVTTDGDYRARRARGCRALPCRRSLSRRRSTPQGCSGPAAATEVHRLREPSNHARPPLIPIQPRRILWRGPLSIIRQ
jgi:hypothetical protein